MDEAQARSAASLDQATQKDLVEEAKKLPGVAAVLEVYGQLAPYVSGVQSLPTTQIRSATGGNDSHALMGRNSQRTGGNRR